MVPVPPRRLAPLIGAYRRACGFLKVLDDVSPVLRVGEALKVHLGALHVLLRILQPHVQRLLVPDRAL